MQRAGGPCFDTPVAPGGYAWWYLDALSDDGAHALTLIGFVGSVFSPYYAAARRRTPGGAADPLHHCALNVALYGRPGRRLGTGWAMTERGRGALHREPHLLRIGPSSMHWDGETLTVEIDEVTVPRPTRLRGTVRLRPTALAGTSYPLDARCRHLWTPIAPRARVEVELSQPALAWKGGGYFDTNSGDAALEEDFSHWHWSRAALGGGRSAVFYDVTRRDGSELALALHFDARGEARHITPPPRATLPPTAWGIERSTRSDGSTSAHVARTLESAPFYARSELRAGVLGEAVTAMHESLAMPRFETRLVQLMLPFRMPRIAG